MQLTPTTKDGKLNITYNEAALRAELERLVAHIKGTGMPYDFYTFDGSYYIDNGHEALDGEECFLCGLPKHCGFPSNPHLDWKPRHDGDGEYEFSLEDLTETVLRAIHDFVDHIAEQIESNKTASADTIYASFKVVGYTRSYLCDLYEDDWIWEKVNIPFKCAWRTT